MELCMRGNGRITKLKARANSSTVTATSMMENGLMTKPTATEFISTPMELSILAFGRMTCNMGSVLRHGRMDPNIRVIMSLEESTALVATIGTTGLFLQEIGKKIKFMELVFISGLTEEVTRVNGAKIIWRVSELTSGRMAVYILANTLMIRNRDMEYINGKTTANTQDIGLMESSMVLEFTLS